MFESPQNLFLSNEKIRSLQTACPITTPPPLSLQSPFKIAFERLRTVQRPSARIVSSGGVNEGQAARLLR